MDELPPPLILEILTRLNNSTDLARCRVVCKTLNSISREVRRINLLCTFDRYTKSRLANTKPLFTPFKALVKDLVLNSSYLESLSVGVEKPLQGTEYDDVEDESDDMYLTDVSFLSEWLPQIGERLKSLSVSDFWIQSCWRRSDVLSLISSYCHVLDQLEVKNAWLSVDSIKTMPLLTSLTLEFVRLDDEDLNQLNESFPSLQVLNLVGVGGLNNPKIDLLHLKTCHWTISNAPVSLTLHAPNLLKLQLDCVKPRSLVLKTPLLSELHLSLNYANHFKLEFLNLRTLLFKSPCLWFLGNKSLFGNTVKKLLIDCSTKFSFHALFDVFPNVTSLTMYYGAWFHVEMICSGNDLKSLEKIVAYLVVDDNMEGTLRSIFYLVDKCSNLVDMALLMNRNIDVHIATSLISRCTATCPRVRWRWGMWKEGTSDSWF